MNETKISWSTHSWNPIHGCSKISRGCDHCYAETLSLRFGITQKPWTTENADENILLKEHRLAEPYRIKQPCRIFVNSTSDLWHAKVPDDYRENIFRVMRNCQRHQFLILTKRPRAAARYKGEWTPNIYQGVSVEDKATLHRVDTLRNCGAHIKFISFEPLLEDLGELNLTDIDWAIVGGESGKNFREMDHAWARNIRDQCLKNEVAFFFKQSAAFRNEQGTQLIEADGSKSTWHQYP